MNYLFSIITPLYKTSTHKIQRLYDSLLEQTHSNWEWIVFDDSPTEHTKSYDYIKNLSNEDDRISLFTENRNCGIIGEVKRKAFYLGKGDILVEVDHDDELVNTCLENLAIAYSYSDDIGFVYGHACEIYEDEKDIIDYGDNWAFGYGSYREAIYKDKKYKVACVGNINPKTIRHITGIPNHVRSWKKDIYHNIGGHNKLLDVSDDYELLIRTFLKTTIAKIDVFTYIQYFERDSSNTQFTKNENIHNIVDKTTNFYNKKIHNRFLELGVDDYVFTNNNFDINIENEIENYTNIIIPPNLLKNNFIGEQTNKIDLFAYSRIYDIEHIIDYKQTEHYNNLIKWVIKLTNCKKYLELGVEDGVTIQIIKKFVNLCVGVDINTPNINIEGINFYNTTTDNFFTINKDNFDIIFIDANHEYKQVKIDFDNSLKILNKFGVIVLHDTDPISNILLDESYCNDAYKIVDYISENNELNIITLPIQETGLSLVMRKNDRRIKKFL